MAHHLAPSAIRDLDEIAYHVATESRSQAITERVIDALSARFTLLGQHPQLGRVRDHDLGNGRRSFAADDYVIVYEIRGQDVRILRIVHGRRNIVALFGE